MSEPTEAWWMDKIRVLGDSRDREQWLATRRKFFTGSEAATLLDAHEYTTLADVLQEKRTGVSDFDGDQDHVKQGILSESFAAAYAEFCWPSLKLEECGLLLADPGCGKLAATPDYVTRDGSCWGLPGPTNVQLKWSKASPLEHPRGKGRWLFRDGPIAVTAPRRGKGGKYAWGTGGTLPSYIYHQVVLEAAVLGFQQSVVLCYHRLAIPQWNDKSGRQMRAYVVQWDQPTLDRLREAAERTEIVNE